MGQDVLIHHLEAETGEKIRPVGQDEDLFQATLRDHPESFRSHWYQAVRFLKPDGDFVLYAHVWAPTAVMLGKAPYPKLDEVAAAVRGK